MYIKNNIHKSRIKSGLSCEMLRSLISNFYRHLILLAIILILSPSSSSIKAIRLPYFSDKCSINPRIILSRSSGSIVTPRFPNSKFRIDRDFEDLEYDFGIEKDFLTVVCEWDIILSEDQDSDKEIVFFISDFDFHGNSLYDGITNGLNNVRERAKNIVSLTNNQTMKLENYETYKDQFGFTHRREKTAFKQLKPRAKIPNGLVEPKCRSGYLHITDADWTRPKNFYQRCIEQRLRRHQKVITRSSKASIRLVVYLETPKNNQKRNYIHVGKGLALSYVTKLKNGIASQSPVQIPSLASSTTTTANQNVYEFGKNNVEHHIVNENLPDTHFIRCNIKGENTNIMNYITEINNPCLNLICPAGCAQIKGNNDIQTPDGRFYGAASSICKSAMHAGVIRDRSGGIFHVCGSASISTTQKHISNNIESSQLQNIGLDDSKNKPSMEFSHFSQENIGNFLVGRRPPRLRNYCKDRINDVKNWTASSSKDQNSTPDLANYQRYSIWRPRNDDPSFSSSEGSDESDSNYNYSGRNTWLQLELQNIHQVTQLHIKGSDDPTRQEFITGFRMQVFNQSLTTEELEDISNMNKKWYYLTVFNGYFKNKRTQVKLVYVDVEDYQGQNVRFTFSKPFPIFKFIRFEVQAMKEDNFLEQKGRAMKVQLDGCKIEGDDEFESVKSVEPTEEQETKKIVNLAVPQQPDRPKIIQSPPNEMSSTTAIEKKKNETMEIIQDNSSINDLDKTFINIPVIKPVASDQSNKNYKITKHGSSPTNNIIQVTREDSKYLEKGSYHATNEDQTPYVILVSMAVAIIAILIVCALLTCCLFTKCTELKKINDERNLPHNNNNTSELLKSGIFSHPVSQVRSPPPFSVLPTPVNGHYTSSEFLTVKDWHNQSQTFNQRGLIPSQTSLNNSTTNILNNNNNTNNNNLNNNNNNLNLSQSGYEPIDYDPSSMSRGQVKMTFGHGTVRNSASRGSNLFSGADGYEDTTLRPRRMGHPSSTSAYPNMTSKYGNYPINNPELRNMRHFSYHGGAPVNNSSNNINNNQSILSTTSNNHQNPKYESTLSKSNKIKFSEHSQNYDELYIHDFKTDNSDGQSKNEGTNSDKSDVKLSNYDQTASLRRVAKNKSKLSLNKQNSKNISIPHLEDTNEDLTMTQPHQPTTDKTSLNNSNNGNTNSEPLQKICNDIDQILNSVIQDNNDYEIGISKNKNENNNEDSSKINKEKNDHQRMRDSMNLLAEIESDLKSQFKS